MPSFKKIYADAVKRKESEETLNELLPPVLTAKQLAKKGDDRLLAMLAKVVNQAGFNWNVIERKWPEFEEAFYGFDLKKLMTLTEEDWRGYLDDTRVVRNWQKVGALMNNTHLVAQLAEEHGSFAKFLADWAPSDQIGLMAYLKSSGSRLGGQTSQWFFRYIGKDGFIITKDVVLAIQGSGYEIADNPTSKKDLTLVQECFNAWQEESGLPYSHLSKIAAYSIGSNYDIEETKAEVQDLAKNV